MHLSHRSRFLRSPSLLISGLMLLPGSALAVKRPGYVRDTTCWDFQHIDIPTIGKLPMAYLAHGENGCVYELNYIVDGQTVSAIAKSISADILEGMDNIMYINEVMEGRKHEMAGLQRVKQFITEVFYLGLPFIIMHRQPGVPYEELEIWWEYLVSPRPQDYHLCVLYGSMMVNAAKEEFKRVVDEYGVVNTDANLSNFLFDMKKVRGKSELEITAHMVDFANWREVTAPAVKGEIDPMKWVGQDLCVDKAQRKSDPFPAVRRPLNRIKFKSTAD